MARRLPAVLMLAALLTFAGLARAQQAQPASSPPEAITLGPSAAPLYGSWKFNVGDSPVDPVTHLPVWAATNFDDSKWETVDLTPSAGSADSVIGYSGSVPGWGMRGHAGYSGYGWYRIRVKVAGAPAEKLALAGPAAFDDAYQVFLNGTLLGGFGRFGGEHPQYFYSQPVVFPLGENQGSGKTGTNLGNATQVIAFRFWLSPVSLVGQSDVGGFRSAPLMGTAEAISAMHQLAWLGVVREQLVWLLSGVMFSALTALALALFLFNRTDRAYFWMGVVFLVSALGDGETALSGLTQTITVPAELWICNVAVLPIIRFAWLMLLWVWFRLERPRWLPWVAALLALAQAAAYAGGYDLLPFISAAIAPVFYAASQMLTVVLLSLGAWLTFVGVRKLGIEGWLMVPMFVLSSVDFLAAKLPFLHLSRVYAPFGVFISSQQIIGFLIALTLCALLVRRWILSAWEQRRMALDLKEAQEVQQVILPEARTLLPGLVVESDYRPAREVGGDFFQVLPHAVDGSLLIVAGDVTGKGLKAGMLVALLVGAVRTAAQYDSDPLEVLNTLNQRLLGRGDAQATCLALRIEPDGRVTLANAGHMPPYLNGEPVNMEGALPLGLIEGAQFSVTRFHLREGDRLMLISDGIVEATDSNGKLFGFDRVHELLRTAARPSEVASAAQQFGQEDDISVISVTRTEVLTPALA